MNLGSTEITTLVVLLRGGAQIQLALLDDNGAVVDLTLAAALALDVYESDGAADPLFSSSLEDDITIADPATEGVALIDFPPEKVALVNSQQLYTWQLTASDVDGNVLYAASGKLIPTYQKSGTSFAVTGNAVGTVLSTRFVNTLSLLGEAGGAGYLDGLVTVAQPVPCVVQFIDTTTGAPQEWTLETSTDATDAGAKRRPLDYHAVTNTKVWRKTS